MRIADVAKLAGVSISTVSKIVNGKDKDINEKTRKRVLKIVKEYNYSPYSKVLNSQSLKTFTLGLLIDEFPGGDTFTKGFLEASQEQNYMVAVCSHFGNPETELKNITRMIRSKVDAVLWMPHSKKSLAHLSHFSDAEIPVFFLSGTGEMENAHFQINFERLAYKATELLIKRGHTAISCVAEMTKNDAFYNGYRACMDDNHIPGLLDDDNMIQPDQLRLTEITGAVCLDETATLKVVQLLRARNLRIPSDFSLVYLDFDNCWNDMLHGLCKIQVPFAEYGSYIAKQIIGSIEKLPVDIEEFNWDVPPVDKDNIARPKTKRAKRILAVGSMNVDVTIRTDTPIHTGVTTEAYSWDMTAGGKGLNQAIGAARLGGRVSMIGKLGADYDGDKLKRILSENTVDISGVMHVENVATGKAYIAVQPDGESSIVVYPGSNACLSVQDIDNNTHLFRGAGFCLLSMEIPEDTLLHAARVAKRHQVKVILKPASAKYMTDELYALADVFVPNKKEARMLCKATAVEKQAAYFREKGVETVIITLGHRGCYLQNAKVSHFYPALDVSAIDTTGGADAFIAALATFLAEGETMEYAVSRANCAAGLSVTRLGVTPALVDRTALDLYYGRDSVSHT